MTDYVTLLQGQLVEIIFKKTFLYTFFKLFNEAEYNFTY